MIVATAGHVDHGKSTLVAALTGQRTDRLPEEQRRGMTIEPGYSHADLGGGRVADFVDLPGHARYLHHLLAGVAAADVALLVVAADDGPMPQTHEHLALLGALGLSRIVPVLTKGDRVGADRAAEVRSSVRRLLAAHGIADAEALEVCAPRGEGLDALRQRLRVLHEGLPDRDTSGGFRLAVDRVFVRSGVGLVVTGTVLAGRVHGGDGLVAQPAGGTLRVRGLQVHGQAVAHARAGQRCALNIVPIAGERPQLERGGWLVAPWLAAPTRRLDVRWQPAVPAEGQPVAENGAPQGAARRARRTTWHLHLGNTTRQVRLVRLGPTDTAPHTQLVLDRPVGAVHGDRFVLRDPATRQVLGGGVVLDASPPARGRSRPQRLAALAALEAPTPTQALSALLLGQPEGVEARAFALNWNLPPASLEALLQQPDALGAVRIEAADGVRLVGARAWQALLDEATHRLAQAHRDEPASRGLADDAMHRALAPKGDAALRRAALEHLRRVGRIERDGFVWRLPGHVARLDDADAELLRRVVAAMEPHGLRPPPLGDIATVLALPLADTAAFLQRAAALGHLVQIAKNRFFLPATLQSLVEVARATAAASPDGRFEVIPFRDRSGIGRNLSIQVLEHFDRVRITRFVGGRRSMVDAAAS